jgi:hypothetical protein
MCMSDLAIRKAKLERQATEGAEAAADYHAGAQAAIDRIPALKLRL